MEDETIGSDQEAPEARAARLTGKLFGLLKDELAEYGGGEAFMRWVRSDSDDEGPPTVRFQTPE